MVRDCRVDHPLDFFRSSLACAKYLTRLAVMRTASMLSRLYIQLFLVSSFCNCLYIYIYIIHFSHFIYTSSFVLNSAQPVKYYRGSVIQFVLMPIRFVETLTINRRLGSSAYGSGVETNRGINYIHICYMCVVVCMYDKKRRM